MNSTASTSASGVSSTWVDRHMNETSKLLLCGGLAGAISKTSTAPLARLTILYQVGGISSIYNYQYTQQGKRPSVFRGLQHVVRTEGLLSLWKGNGVTILHRIPYSAANFWTYEKVNELWKDQFVYGNSNMEEEEEEEEDEGDLDRGAGGIYLRKRTCSPSRAGWWPGARRGWWHVR